MSADLVSLLKNIVEQQREQMILLDQTINCLTNLKNASPPIIVETDPIAANIIANLPGYIYWKNEKGQYLGANNNLVKISGLNDRTEIIGKTDGDFEWGKGMDDQFRADDQEVMRDKIAKIFENKLSIKRTDGYYYYVRTEKKPLYEDGKIVGVLAIAVDITDQKLLEKKLKEQQKIFKQANLEKTEFIRNTESELEIVNQMLDLLQTVCYP